MKIRCWLIGIAVLIGLWGTEFVASVEAARPYVPPGSSKDHQAPASRSTPYEPIIVPLPPPQQQPQDIDIHQEQSKSFQEILNSLEEKRASPPLGKSESFQDVLNGLEGSHVPLPLQRLIDPPPLPWVLRGKYTIVVDAGHGGKDPGAKSRKGVYEKHITLKAAKRLKKKLEKTKRYRVILTRNKDHYVKLRDRIAIARKHKADLFISLHADKIKSSKIRGLSVYTLSDKASDKEAAGLARHANKSGTDIIDGLDLSGESREVTNILIGLVQRETMNLSAQFAKRVMYELGKVTTLLRKTHRFAGFAVLKAPDIPSVLIEMGYLSNRRDEAFLLNTKKRNKLLDALVKAIDTYFLYDHPKM